MAKTIYEPSGCIIRDNLFFCLLFSPDQTHAGDMGAFSGLSDREELLVAEHLPKFKQKVRREFHTHPQTRLGAQGNPQTKKTQGGTNNRRSTCGCILEWMLQSWTSSINSAPCSSWQVDLWQIQILERRRVCWERHPRSICSFKNCANYQFPFQHTPTLCMSLCLRMPTLNSMINLLLTWLRNVCLSCEHKARQPP